MDEKKQALCKAIFRTAQACAELAAYEHADVQYEYDSERLNDAVYRAEEDLMAAIDDIFGDENNG